MFHKLAKAILPYYMIFVGVFMVGVNFTTPDRDIKLSDPTHIAIFRVFMFLLSLVLIGMGLLVLNYRKHSD